MPELPEVETMRRGLLPIVGGRVTAVVRPPCRHRPIAVLPSWPQVRRRLVGRTLVRVERRGKRVLLRADDEGALVFEPRMTGLVLLADPPDRGHLRFGLALAGAAAPQLWFWDRRGLGSVRWLAADELERALGGEKLGPDALAVSAADLQARLAPRRREIKVALLDQTLLAGVGNLYASEALHVARLHPQRRCPDLRPAEWRRLHAALAGVLAEAIRYEGSTLADGTYRNALNQAGGYQNHHRVYDRAGERCPRCRREEVRRIVQAQRATFFCPRCQT